MSWKTFTCNYLQWQDSKLHASEDQRCSFERNLLPPLQKVHAVSDFAVFIVVVFFTYNIKQASELRTLMCSVYFLCLINSVRKKFLSWSFIIHSRFLSVYAGDLSDWGSALSQVASALSVWLPDLKQPACQMVLNCIYLFNK